MPRQDHRASLESPVELTQHVFTTNGGKKKGFDKLCKERYSEKIFSKKLICISSITSAQIPKLPNVHYHTWASYNLEFNMKHNKALRNPILVSAKATSSISAAWLSLTDIITGIRREKKPNFIR